MNKILILLLPLLLLAAGCGPAVHYELPREFTAPDGVAAFISANKKFISGRTLYLDPGHGGTDRKSKGPGGLVTEADINLRVALHLRSFLTAAGATVILSRDFDTLIALRDRSTLANASGAELFISIHHNAPGSDGERAINYTSTYYHALETDYDYEPMERDVARFIQRDLSYAMRNAGGLGSFDGTYSDYFIYPGQGFSVLRHTEIPAVLIECSFFTNPYEEQKLALDEFNRIQAWGIFRGLCRYYRAGVPEVGYVGSRPVQDSLLESTFTVADTGSGINPREIQVWVNRQQEERVTYLPGSTRLTVTHSPGDVRVIAANKNGNHNRPFIKIISR